MSDQYYNQGRFTLTMMPMPKELSKLLPTELLGVQNNLTMEWEKGVIRYHTETSRSYIVIASQGGKKEK